MKGQATSGNRCIVTGKTHMYGNNVSHSHRKTRMRQSPNIHRRRFFSDEKGKWVKLTVSAKGIKTINKRGIDAILRDLEAKGYTF